MSAPEPAELIGEEPDPDLIDDDAPATTLGEPPAPAGDVQD